MASAGAEPSDREPGRTAGAVTEDTSPLTIAVSQLAWEMGRWETHALRNLALTLLSLINAHDRVHKSDVHSHVPIAECDELAYDAQRAWTHFEHNRERALRRPAFRRARAFCPAPTEDAPDVPTGVQ